MTTAWIHWTYNLRYGRVGDVLVSRIRAGEHNGVEFHDITSVDPILKQWQ